MPEPGDYVPKPGPYEMHKGDRIVPAAVLTAFVEAEGARAATEALGEEIAARRRTLRARQCDLLADVVARLRRRLGGP